MSVLIVEDSLHCAKLFREVLSIYGIEVRESRNGAQALAMAREHRPSLILMDLRLPDRSGIAVTRELKQDDRLSDVPVIAITASGSARDEASARACGCDDYIVKPVSLLDLIHTVRRYVPQRFHA